MKILVLKIILNITSLLPPMNELVECVVTRLIKKKRARTIIMIVMQRIQYSANVYHATFYTLENNVRPFEALMNEIRLAVMIVEMLSIFLDRRAYERIMDYLLATHNNLLFSVDRLNGFVSHEEWRILPDIEQQCGNVFALYRKAQKALR